MSIRFSIVATSSESADEDVVIDAHHIDTTGSWFEHPIRSHKLRLAYTLNLLAHVALGFVLHRGHREELCLHVTHDDPAMAHSLELVMEQPLETHPDVLPGAITLDQAAQGIEMVECERLVIPPGGNASITLYRASHVRIREVLIAEGGGCVS